MYLFYVLCKDTNDYGCFERDEAESSNEEYESEKDMHKKKEKSTHDICKVGEVGQTSIQRSQETEKRNDNFGQVSQTAIGK